MYVSPLVDQGYDIADYEHIDPVFGTDADFDELVKKAKELGISIIMDLVVNHCSSEHVWFKKAIADKIHHIEIISILDRAKQTVHLLTIFVLTLEVLYGRKFLMRITPIIFITLQKSSLI